MVSLKQLITDISQTAGCPGSIMSWTAFLSMWTLRTISRLHLSLKRAPGSFLFCSHGWRKQPPCPGMSWMVAIHLDWPKEQKQGKQANMYTGRQLTSLQGRTRFSKLNVSFAKHPLQFYWSWNYILCSDKNILNSQIVLTVRWISLSSKGSHINLIFSSIFWSQTPVEQHCMQNHLWQLFDSHLGKESEVFQCPVWHH